MNKYDMISFMSRFMNGPEEHELFKVLDELPDIIQDEMWLAGGAVRRTITLMELESDFDFFFKSESILKQYSKALENLGAQKTASTDHQVTYCIDIDNKPRIIQLIRISYYQSAEKVIDSFDFTITQFAYDGEYLYTGDYSLWDLARKRLALHKLTYGVATMRRLIKYTNQGFTACAGVMQSILEAVVANPSVVQSDIQYID